MHTQQVLRLYYFIIYLVLVFMLCRFWGNIEDAEFLTRLFATTALLSYPMLYLLPTLVISGITLLLLKLFTKGVPFTARGQATLYGVNLLCGGLTLVFIYADLAVFDIYEYHFNGFVWNLITTSGGIAFLGATTGTKITYALQSGGLIALSGLLLCLAHRFNRGRLALSRRVFSLTLVGLMLLLLGEEAVYGISRFTNNEPILQTATIIPLHLETSFRSFAKRMVIVPPAQMSIRLPSGTDNYPLAPIVQEQPKPLNIVWLTAESPCWDMLTPEIMPNLSRFAQQSGGNRTRMGMFTMFYGLYAPYWYPFQKQRIGPVLIDVLLQNGYQMSVNTSQSFSYPELKDTVFANVAREDMHELADGAPPPERDAQNISEILRFFNQRDAECLFFAFMFFEATHAPYTFLLEDVVRSDYLEEMSYLKKQGLLERALVLFTGDHGEEFMENGRWGTAIAAAFRSSRFMSQWCCRFLGVPPLRLTQ